MPTVPNRPAPAGVGEVNRLWWEERAALHGGDGFFYDTDAFLRGRQAITDREVGELRAAVGDPSGIELLHLQCHIGLGTLSLARLGARVTGLDFSPIAIERARALARRARLHADFVVADAHSLPASLRGRFHAAFASHGAVVWIEDLDAWMRSAGAALRPGGSLVLVDGHPFSLMVSRTDPPILEGAYGGGARVEGIFADYADRGAATDNDAAVLHRWNLGEVVTSAVRAGLRVDALTEWSDDEMGAPTGGKVRKGDDGLYRLRLAGADVPLMFSLRASKR